MKFLLLLAACLITPILSPMLLANERPNILVLMVDDLGYSDLGCYGSEIATPNLDALASGGLRFSQFYNTAKCHSSRVSLLTGQYCLAAGDTALTHGVTSAEVLKASGYSTAMTGKWHLRGEPTDFGFTRYFGHLSGACNYFRGDNTFRLNGQPWQVPPQGFYTTVANVDYGLQFLRESESQSAPWYLYIAFNAPHAPLQALPEDYAKYAGHYEKGWDAIRQERFARQLQSGILPSTTKISPRPEHVPAWDSLTEPRKRFEIKRMQALAGMIDRVDQEIGRVVAYLKSTGQFDNTLIWFVSDNGACPYDRSSNAIQEEPTSGSVSWSDSTGWAWARNCPFRFYKQNQFEGGISTPAIVHWPQGITAPRGSVCDQPAHLIDIMPTIAEVTQSEIPADFPGRQLRKVSGQSIAATFAGGAFKRQQPLHLLFATDRGLRDGAWKAVSFRSSPWELYDMTNDRTELNNLARQHPERLKAMVDQWTAMARDVLHAGQRVYAPVSEQQSPHQHPEWTQFDRDPQAGARGNAKPGKRLAPATGAKGKRRGSIRARKNTTLKINDDQTPLNRGENVPVQVNADDQ